jgi:hypothetical protein
VALLNRRRDRYAFALENRTRGKGNVPFNVLDDDIRVARNQVVDEVTDTIATIPPEVRKLPRFKTRIDAITKMTRAGVTNTRELEGLLREADILFNETVAVYDFSKPIPAAPQYIPMPGAQPPQPPPQAPPPPPVRGKHIERRLVTKQRLKVPQPVEQTSETGTFVAIDPSEGPSSMSDQPHEEDLILTAEQHQKRLNRNKLRELNLKRAKINAALQEAEENRANPDYYGGEYLHNAQERLDLYDELLDDFALNGDRFGFRDQELILKERKHLQKRLNYDKERIQKLNTTPEVELESYDPDGPDAIPDPNSGEQFEGLLPVLDHPLNIHNHRDEPELLNSLDPAQIFNPVRPKAVFNEATQR